MKKGTQLVWSLTRNGGLEKPWSWMISSTTIMRKALNMNVNTVKKYSRMMKKDMTLHKTSGKPRVIDDGADFTI